jgi:hypothetical protein
MMRPYGDRPYAPVVGVYADVIGGTLGGTLGRYFGTLDIENVPAG